MSLRILQLGPYPPPEGGISRNMLAIREELLKRGHTCSIIATSRSSRVDAGQDVYHPNSVLKLLRLLSSLDFDVLHLHIGGDVSRRVLSLAMACALFAKDKSILTLHSGEYPVSKEGQKASQRSLRGRIFHRFSRLVAVNAAIANVFRRYGINEDRIRIILPYALRQPDPVVKMPNGFISFYKRHSPMLLAVGGLEKDYDPLFQIASMNDILKSFPQAGLMIVGDGSMRHKVEVAVEESGYKENILLGGNVEHHVVLHLIKDADILLRTTLFDGDAISIREALFLGTPVIATDVSERPDGVELIKVGDKTALLEATRRALQKERNENQQLQADNTQIKQVVDLYQELALAQNR
jgi:glycogen synthase